MSKYERFDLEDEGVVSESHAVSGESTGSSSCSIASFWNTILFMWIKPLLELGNKQPLDFSDLFELSPHDRAVNIYASFLKAWKAQVSTKSQPSLVMAYVHAFGFPFFMAGGLKLIHDMLIFVGPFLLNRIIYFLDESDEPLYVGLIYVAGLFFSNLVMSLCLRQYFFWCYRVGMRLRSAVVTSVFEKSLVVSAGVLSRRTIGEISNLMSVDSTRLQTLTNYLHAIWYSFVQIALALFFLWGQVGPACLGGITIIIIAIPVTQQISARLKKIQKELSEVRDARVKLNNEVLSGMKVIKFQAWEQEFQSRIDEARSRELEVYRRAIYLQTLSGAVYTALPLSVGICTFTVYVSMGNELDVATALTSLALFEILRFPLFILPMVINNIVEARVSIDRVQSFLLEPEKRPVPSEPLRDTGILFSNATLVYESIKQRLSPPVSELSQSAAFLCDARSSPTPPSVPRVLAGALYVVRGVWYCIRATYSGAVTLCMKCFLGKSLATPAKSITTSVMSDVEFELLVRRAQVEAAEMRLLTLEEQQKTGNFSKVNSRVSRMSGRSSRAQGQKGVRGADSPLHTLGNEGQTEKDGNTAEGDVELTVVSDDKTEEVDEGKDRGERLLTLFRVSMQASRGALLCIVGKVGSGKSSILMSLLGDMLCVLGEVAIRGRVAYVGQRPFIQNCTLKENILFGCAYDQEKYDRTLKMCALLPDLEVLPAGDQTEIGERGINLSGGQKARVALARAVYADTDVVLLDDPLAAVDAHVGQHLFDECVMSLVAANKCVVLVTNALQFIREATGIVVLDGGCVVESGSYDELMARQGPFWDMMATHAEGMCAADDARAIQTSSDPVHDSSLTGLDGEKGSSADGDVGTPARTRGLSTSSASSSSSKHQVKAEKQKTNADSGKLMSTEDREVGSVSLKVYGKWAIAAGGLYAGVIMIAIFAFGEFTSVMASYWLSYWSAHRDDNSAWYYLKIYIGINCGVLVVMTCRDLYTALVGWRAGRHLFGGMMVSVLHAPMAFFDTTPMGRILNRFTKDVLTVDVDIPRTVKMYLGTMAKVVSTVLYISIITPLFLLGLGPIAFFYYKAQQYFIKTSRELTRLDSVSRSPIYALFSETLDGLSTIRAFGEERRLTNKSNGLLDANQRAYFLNFSANCWLGVRLELAGTLIITFAALSAVISRQFYVHDTVENRHEFAGMAGLAISLALGVTQSLNWSVRMASDLESQMVAVERVESFATMEQEAAHLKPLTDPSDESHWPTEGELKLTNVSMRYRPDLPLVLAGVTVHIKPREKVGIVGRTGAGKSSLVTAILRLVEISGGKIEIDGVDVSTLGLRTLRSAVAIIPQDPVLFSGTVRSNLDPFNLYTDGQCWESIRRTQLAESIRTLQDRVEDNGANFSVGQRQLLCIARALLSKAKVIIMDEATAAVDVETDAAIQQTIREEFAYATCLTVAHRLNTILDSDKVMVMDKGKVAEYDTPQKLLANPKSLFYALVENWEAVEDDV
mmetsp:Transcript_20744/g.29812  ORF Transcript_20744/g.29812 Transcript_20744/m.29812 type:complete len:1497 (+) Transcript_20744:45-4535(+)